MKLRSRHGCMSCKLRKRKCDEQRPACDHCSRLGYQCEWLSDITTVERYKAAIQARRQRRDMPIGLIPERERAQSVEGITGLRIANRENLRISFLLHRMFTGANSAIQSGAAGASLTVYTELQFAADETSLTYGCVNAMAMIYWGAVHNDPSTLSAGYNARGQNLMELRRALTENTADISGDLLAAVALMRLADTLMPNARSQWMIHAKALTHLFRAVGPQGFTTPPMLRFVENNRWVLIMAASVLRQPTFLSSNEWKTIPWQHAEKDMLQTLLDVYARIPTLHALFDQAFLPARDEGMIEQHKKGKFDAELNTILFEMQKWRHSVDEQLAQSAKPWDCKRTTITPLYPDRATISLEKLHHAYAVVLFNMMIIVLSLYISKTSGITYAGPDEKYTHKKRTETILEPFTIPFGNPLQRAAAAADEIAQIMPWTMQDSHKGAGALYMAAPAVVCDQFWRPFKMNKSLWFGAALSQVGGLWESLLLLNPSRANDLIKVLI